MSGKKRSTMMTNRAQMDQETNNTHANSTLLTVFTFAFQHKQTHTHASLNTHVWPQWIWEMRSSRLLTATTADYGSLPLHCSFPLRLLLPPSIYCWQTVALCQEIASSSFSSPPFTHMHISLSLRASRCHIWQVEKWGVLWNMWKHVSI